MRSLPPQLSFADLELQFQGVQLDPILRTISEFLDQHLTLLEQVRKDLERGLKNARTGRNGIAPSQVLRSLVLMRVKNWDYRELQERIHDGFTLRSFTAFDASRSPSTMRSTAPSTGLHRRRFVISINSWSRRLSNWVWKTARLSASTPRWWNPIFITPPTPPCCGTRFAPSPALSRISRRNFPAECRALPTAPAALAAACRRSNA